MDLAVMIGAAAAVLASLSGKKRRYTGVHSVQKVGPQATLLNPADSMRALGLQESDWPQMKFDIPFAAGNASPIWPIVTNNPKKFVVSYLTTSNSIVGNGARRFMADRDGNERYHVGVDLYGNDGDVILSMEDGVIVNHYHFYHGTYALFVQCNSGLVINYGEVRKDSWQEFGLKIGSKVKKGRPIARIGLMSGGSNMCHLETYMPTTDKNRRYTGGDFVPILNPTYYLLRAQFLAIGGRVFSGVSQCEAMRSMNRPIPENLKHIEIEDQLVNERPSDSVLPELLVDYQWRPNSDRSDGP